MSSLVSNGSSNIIAIGDRTEYDAGGSDDDSRMLIYDLHCQQIDQLSLVKLLGLLNDLGIMIASLELVDASCDSYGVQQRRQRSTTDFEFGLKGLKLRVLSNQQKISLATQFLEDNHDLFLKCTVTILGSSLYAWFPRSVYDLSKYGHVIIKKTIHDSRIYQGYCDGDYLERKTYFLDKVADINKRYDGAEDFQVNYTNKEMETWRLAIRRLKLLHESYASSTYRDNFLKLNEACRLMDMPANVELVSRFLHNCSGFRLKVCKGILKVREFYAYLAYRIYPVRLHMRHFLSPYHCPEPDILHDIVGVVPLLMIDSIANFLHMIGMFSLGASIETLDKIDALYRHVFEYLLLREDTENRAMGATLLSSYGELCHCLSDKVIHRTFNIRSISKGHCNENVYQESYVFIEDLDSVIGDIQKYLENEDDRPFSVTYDILRDCVFIRNVGSGSDRDGKGNSMINSLSNPEIE